MKREFWGYVCFAIMCVLGLSGCTLLQLPGEILGHVFGLLGKLVGLAGKMPMPPPWVFN